MKTAEKLYIILALFGIILEASGSITCDLQVSINGVTNNYYIIEATVGDTAFVTCNCSAMNYIAYLTKINLKNYTITHFNDNGHKTLSETLLDPLSFTCCQHDTTYHCSITKFLNVMQSEPVTSSSTIPSSSQCISPSSSMHSSTSVDADSTYTSSIKSIISSVDIPSSITSDNEQLVPTTANTVPITANTDVPTTANTDVPITGNTDVSTILHDVSPIVQTDVPAPTTVPTDVPAVATITEIMSSCPTVQTVTESMSPSPIILTTTVAARGPEATANTFYGCFQNNNGFIAFVVISLFILIIQFLVCIAVILCCRYKNKKRKSENDLTFQNNYQTQSAGL